MKNNFTLISSILFFVLVFFLPVSFSQGLSSNELIKNAKQYDGKLITYSGEVIGDVMLRDKFAWVNINDGDNAIGVWLSSSLAKEINFTGSYKTRGDVLEITGILYSVCRQHGGDLDLHAQALRKISSGRLLSQKLNFDKLNLSLILLGALFLIWILSLFRRK